MGLVLRIEKMPCMLTNLEGIMAEFIFLRTARSLTVMKRLLSAGFLTSGQIRPPQGCAGARISAERSQAPQLGLYCPPRTT